MERDQVLDAARKWTVRDLPEIEFSIAAFMVRLKDGDDHPDIEDVLEIFIGRYRQLAGDKATDEMLAQHRSGLALFEELTGAGVKRS